MKAVGYIRVSTGKQVRKGQGIGVQRDLIKKYCATNKMDLIRIYEDKGISGAKADEKNLTIEREGLQDMLADIHNLNVKHIVVLNTSRLWRSDFVKVLIQRELIPEFCTKYPCEINLGFNLISIDSSFYLL